MLKNLVVVKVRKALDAEKSNRTSVLLLSRKAVTVGEVPGGGTGN